MERGDGVLCYKLARVAQFELANLKRMYKIDGLTEAEIHTIIPDRPVGKKTSK